MDAFDRDWLSRQTFRAKSGFFNSHWVRFHRAALKHRALFDELRMSAPSEVD
ncbi:hypothetical protein J7M28_08705 [bacterium]|nr:hypothetical protein [bacterium]